MRTLLALSADPASSILPFARGMGRVSVLDGIPRLLFWSTPTEARAMANDIGRSFGTVLQWALMAGFWRCARHLRARGVLR